MTRPSPLDIVEGAIHRHLLSPDDKAIKAAAREILRHLSDTMGRPHNHPHHNRCDLAGVYRAAGWDDATRFLWDAADEPREVAVDR